MKTARSFIKSSVLLVTVAVLFSSCTFFDLFSVDSLIRPPKLTGENAVIQQAFEAAVGNDTILLSPVSGAYRSAFVQFDIDRDGSKETLVFYARNNSPNEARMHMLKYDGAKWYSAGDVPGNGSEVYAVSFYDFDKTPGFEVAVTWTVSDSKRNKTLSLFRIENNGDEMLSALSVFQLFDYLVSDLDFDGQPELLYLTENSADLDQPFKACVIKMAEDDAEFRFVCELHLRRHVSLPLKISYDIRNGRYRLYIDCINNDGTYYTELLYYDLEAAVLSRLTDLSGGELSQKTVRSVNALCEDVNDDRIIDVPVEVPIPTGASGESLSCIKYAECDNHDLLEQAVTYYYAADGGFRFRLDPFLKDYTVQFDRSSGALCFYYFGKTEQPDFTVQCSAATGKRRSVTVVISDGAASDITESAVAQYAEIL